MTALALAGGLALLYFGGEVLVGGATALAARLGLSPLAIGLTVVAFGTSMPELVVSVGAALGGANDISLGNVVGSNIANIALILGLAALLRPVVVNARVVKVDGPIMIAVSLVLVAMLLGGSITRWFGGLLLLGLAAYVLFTLREARQESASVREEFVSALTVPTQGTAASGALVLVGFAMLVGGGRLLVAAAVSIATALGVGQAAIGLTIVAVGTSLPELATSVVASLRGQGDIAVGNAVGSNIFNILGILGATAVIRPLRIGGITGIDLAVMAGLAVVLTILLARGRLGRRDGTLLLACFVLYTGWLLAG